MIERGKGWTMHLGDCLEVMATLDRVDHIITDPPYSEHVHAKSLRGGPQAPPLSSDGKWYACSYARARDFGFAAITGREMTEASAWFARLAKRWTLVFSNVELAAGWRARLERFKLDYVRTLAWVKEAAAPQFTGDRPAPGFEAMTLAHPKGRKRWNGGGKQGVYSQRVAGNQPGSIRPRVHTAQKPLELMLALVDDFTDPGDVVLDAFAGSATTGLACIRRGRNFIGIERDPKSFETAVASLRAEESGSDLVAHRAGQGALFK